MQYAAVDVDVAREGQRGTVEVGRAHALHIDGELYEWVYGLGGGGQVAKDRIRVLEVVVAVADRCHPPGVVVGG